MTTTNVYQGIGEDRNSSRVLKAPGGGSSNIFGGYVEEEQREQQDRRQRETNAVMQSNQPQGSGDTSHNFQDNKDSFAANRNRNHGAGAPFATSDSMVSGGQKSDRASHNQAVIGADYRTPKEMQAANKNRNQGSGAPFATANDDGPVQQHSGRDASMQQTVGDDYITPQQRQANNPNKAANSFNNLFGDSDSSGMNGGKAQGGKVSKHNPITWSAKQRDLLTIDTSQDTGRDGHRPAGYRRPDEDNEAPHLRICEAVTVSQFNPVTWSAKPGARSPPIAAESLAAPPAGMVKKSTIADDKIKPPNPHSKASLPSHLTATSPHNCLSVRASPITGISPFYQTAEQLKPQPCETQYRPVQGILPPTPTTPPHYYRDALLYTPHDCILPSSPPDHEIHRQGDHGENKAVERNPVTGLGVASVSSPAIKCYTNTHASADRRSVITGQGFKASGFYNATDNNNTPSPAPHNDPLHWQHSNLALLSIKDVDIPLRSKGQGVKSDHQVATHNPVTWEAYSNFDEAQDGPKHRSRFEIHADAKAGGVNPITGQDRVGNKPSTKVHAPPGGASSIQF